MNNYIKLVLLGTIVIMGAAVVRAGANTAAEYTSKDLVDAIKGYNYEKVKNIVSKNAALAVTPYVILKNDKNEDVTDLPIMLCGNKLKIAQLLYAEHVSQKKPLAQNQLENLLFFAFGSESIPVAKWLINELKVNAKARLEWYRYAGGKKHTNMFEELGLEKAKPKKH